MKYTRKIALVVFLGAGLFANGCCENCSAETPVEDQVQTREVAAAQTPSPDEVETMAPAEVLSLAPADVKIDLELRFIGNAALPPVSDEASAQTGKKAPLKTVRGLERAWLDLYDTAGLPDISGCKRTIDFPENKELEHGPGTSAEAIPYWRCSGGVEIGLLNGFSRVKERQQRMTRRPAPFWYISNPGSFSDLHFYEPLKEKLLPQPASFVTELKEKIKKERARQLGENQGNDYSSDFVGYVEPYLVWTIEARWAEMQGQAVLANQAIKLARGAFPKYKVTGDREQWHLKRLASSAYSVLVYRANQSQRYWMPKKTAISHVTSALALRPKLDKKYKEVLEQRIEGWHLALSQDAAIEKALSEGKPPGEFETLIFAMRDIPDPFCPDFQDRKRAEHEALPPNESLPPNTLELPSCPGDRIAQLGRGVVPALIPLLDDKTMTRSLNLASNSFAADPATLGEIVGRVIAKIAGLEISNKENVDDRVRQWWKDIEGEAL